MTEIKNFYQTNITITSNTKEIEKNRKYVIDFKHKKL